MPIVKKYTPAAALIGDAALLGGQGQFAQRQDQFNEDVRRFDLGEQFRQEQLGLSRDQFAESQRQFDAGQALREAQFAEGQRQFNLSDDYRRDALGQQAYQQRQNRLFQANSQYQNQLFNAQSQQFQAAEANRRLQLGAALEAEQQRQREEALLEQQAMVTAQREQDSQRKWAIEQWEVEQGFREKDAQFVDTQVKEVLDYVQDFRSDISTDHQGEFNAQMSKLRAIQRARGTTIRDGQYVRAISDWLAEFERSDWDQKTTKPPTAQEVLEQEMARLEDGRKALREVGSNGGVRWKIVDPPKDDTPATPFSDQKAYDSLYNDAFKRLMIKRNADHQAALKHYDPMTAGEGAVAPQLSLPSEHEVAAEMQRYMSGMSAFQSGMPAPQEAQAPQGMPSGETRDDYIDLRDIPHQDLVQILPQLVGKWIFNPDTNQVEQLLPIQ